MSGSRDVPAVQTRDGAWIADSRCAMRDTRRRRFQPVAGHRATFDDDRPAPHVPASGRWLIRRLTHAGQRAYLLQQFAIKMLASRFGFFDPQPRTTIEVTVLRIDPDPTARARGSCESETRPNES